LLGLLMQVKRAARRSVFAQRRDADHADVARPVGARRVAVGSEVNTKAATSLILFLQPLTSTLPQGSST